jgi:hypothetical protein
LPLPLAIAVERLPVFELETYIAHPEIYVVASEMVAC